VPSRVFAKEHERAAKLSALGTAVDPRELSPASRRAGAKREELVPPLRFHRCSKKCKVAYHLI
jgi:hypothetical protein